MSGIGPLPGDPDTQHELCPTCAVDVTLGSDFDLTAQFACKFARELYVGVGGDVVATMTDDGGTAHTYKNVPSGTTLHGLWVTVKSSANGTTATNIVARR